MIRWKTIEGFKDVIDNLYEISDNGDVRWKSSKDMIHKKIANKKHHPYYAVHLKKFSGRSEWVLVHQLVATFFVAKPDRYDENEELVPDHLDNDGLNNYYKNLEWKTRGENVSSAFKNGYINNSGENGAWAIISNDEARKICEYLQDGFGYKEILKKMNYPFTETYRTLLVRIKNRVAWKDISKDYNFGRCKTQYTPTQLDTIKKIPEILKLINDGYRNYEIANIIWKGETKNKLVSKAQTVGNIRRGKIFKEYL